MIFYLDISYIFSDLTQKKDPEERNLITLCLLNSNHQLLQSIIEEYTKLSNERAS